MEQRPILLFLRKLIACIPVNIEMVSIFFFLSSFSLVWGRGETSLPSYSSDELWGSGCRPCREKCQAVSRALAQGSKGSLLLL